LKPPTISVIIPAHNAAGTIDACLGALAASSIRPHECLVIDDGSTDETAAIARRHGVRLIRTECNRGAASTRNLGAASATGDILVFIDADVCVHRETLERIRRRFQEDASLAALFGCYDDSPHAPEFLSQYRNLMHCYVHRRGRREASTFWTGCGAIRRRVFELCGGFGASLPGMEDVELGYRLRKSGRRILLDPEIQVQHRKQWRLWNMLKTDLLRRGLPWVELIWRHRLLPNDLNLGAAHRISLAASLFLLAAVAWGAAADPPRTAVALGGFFFALLGAYWSEFLGSGKGAIGAASFTVSLVAGAWGLEMPLLATTTAALFVAWAALRGLRRRPAATAALGALTAAGASSAAAAFAAVAPPAAAVAGALLSGIVILNAGFYRFLTRRRGLLFAVAAVPFQLLYHLNNALCLVLGTGRYLTRSARPQPPVLAQRQSSSD